MAEGFHVHAEPASSQTYNLRNFKRALVRGDDPEEVIRRISDYRTDQEHHFKYYAAARRYEGSGRFETQGQLRGPITSSTEWGEQTSAKIVTCLQRTKSRIERNSEAFMATSAHSELQKINDSAVHFELLLDSTEAAALLRIHPKTLQRMARNGDIAGIQIGKLWRFRASVLNSWLIEKARR
jgi:excisionase family DNA binding protein